MDVYSRFPYLIPQDAKRNHYSGFIQVKSQCFQLQIRLDPVHGIRGASIDLEWRLKELLRGYEELLHQRLKQSNELVDFLQELHRLLEVRLSKTGKVQSGRQQNSGHKLYSQLIEEIEEIGWSRLVFIESDFKQLHLMTEDEKNRQHILKVNLQTEHPNEPPKCVVDFPKAFDFTWTAKHTLKDLLGQLSRNLEMYQEFWDCLDEIDEKTWVLEPEKPCRADCGRRIALGNNASVQITVSIQHPRMFPECRFLGADHAINPLKAKLNENLHKWDASQSLLYNLQKVLETEFPSPSKTNKEDFSVECGICYAYRLGDEIPEEACDNPQCGQPFHQSCLYEWLRALPSFRQSFNVAFGECPYCSTAITMKISKK